MKRNAELTHARPNPLRRVIEHHLSKIVGLPLAQISEAGGIWMFDFGSLVRIPGKNAWRSDWTLHVQCPWRIVSRNGILVGCDDRWLNVEEATSSSYPTTTPNSWSDSLGCAIVARFLGKPEADKEEGALRGDRNELIRAVADRFGGVRLSLSGGHAIEIVPAASRSEQWRFFRAGDIKSHFVVGAGVILEEPSQ